MVRINQARRGALTILFVFGFAVIAWVPRIPEIKAHLGLAAGIFGLLTAFGTIGAICSSFLSSRAIDLVGSKRAIAFFGTATFLQVALLPLIYNPALYALVMFTYGAATNALSTSLNVQSLHIEERRGVPSMSAFHGSWAAGALLTSVFSTALVEVVSLEFQMICVSVVALIILWLSLSSLITPSEEAALEPDGESISIRVFDLIRPSRTAILIGIGISGGCFAEYAAGDWSAIYVREILGTSLSRAAFSFTFIMLAITASRLLGDRFIGKFGPERVIRSAGIAILGGLSLVSLAGHISGVRTTLFAVLMTYTGFAIAGLGSGVMVPTFISATTNIDAPRPIALGQVILIQQTLIWILKALMSLAVARFGLENAMLIPAIVALAAVSLAGLTAKRPLIGQPLAQ